MFVLSFEEINRVKKKKKEKRKKKKEKKLRFKIEYYSKQSNAEGVKKSQANLTHSHRSQRGKTLVVRIQ